MWYLTSQNGEKVIFIPPNGKITIGRCVDPATTFAFPEDNSISRKHATLIIKDEKLLLIDMDSKYGTFISNNKEASQMSRITNNVGVSLEGGTKVRFGVLSCIWLVHNLNFVTCASTVKGENLQTLKKYIDEVGGTFKNEWDEACSFLTMPAITVTIKVVLALAQGAHIVSLDFWKKCAEAIANKQVPPNPEDFVPEVIESTLNKDAVSFLPNMQRKRIFAGKKFVFFSRKQMDMYKPVLKMCAGGALLLSENKLTRSQLCAKDVVVVQYNITGTSQESQSQQIQINGIVSFLQNKNKRVVADPEIGLAVLYCSVAKYCNPDFNFSSEVVKQSSTSDTAKQPTVLAMESQDTNKNVTKENVLINESLAPNTKRKIDETEPSTENANKKFASENIVSNPTNESEDLFEFLNQKDNAQDKDTSERRLNLTKPQKRKSDFDNDEDDMFNFVPVKKEKIDNEYSNKNKIFDDSNEIETPLVNPKLQVKDEYINRGLSIRELIENSAGWKCCDMIIIDDDAPNGDLEDKMNDLNLGVTVVTINRNLVRERQENIPVTDQESGVKNFKKFKKIWPIKMQVTVIPKTRMSVVKADASVIGDIPGESDTDDEVIPLENDTHHKPKSIKCENF